MRKSKYIGLVLITSALASCNRGGSEEQQKRNVYMRSDTSASYTRINHHSHSPMLWYYAFRPIGFASSNGFYSHSGYYSGGLAETSNVGTNRAKGHVVRGGFGKSGFATSS